MPASRPPPGSACRPARRDARAGRRRAARPARRLRERARARGRRGTRRRRPRDPRATPAREPREPARRLRGLDPELDVLVEKLAEAGALGARLTGAGFGGCVVGLADRDEADCGGRDGRRPLLGRDGPPAPRVRLSGGRRRREGRMITRDELREAQAYAAEQLEAAGIALSDAERAAIEVADFGLSRLREVGLLRARLREHRPLLREGARPLPGPDLPRAPPSAVRRLAGEGGDVPLPQRASSSSGSPDEELVLAAGRAAHDPAGHAALVPGGAGRARSCPSSRSTSRDELDVFTDPAVERATVVDA